ncbi:SDR family oxidoreductase [Mycobacterium sp. JS623]|uniref:SDR family oxidoreductase n=1 Tax=Mycobacterium sp. JS623 TaxID=212767 RepID=UPI000A04D769|nr:SDR family oxidoreductase [Mycobacterium sp. JS623]
MRSNEKPQRQVAVSTGGALGLMRTLARELAPRIIGVNTTNPTDADSPMSNNGFGGTRLEENRELGDAIRGNLMPVEPMPIPMQDIPHVVAWLVSDEAKRVTSKALPVHAGFELKKREVLI